MATTTTSGATGFELRLPQGERVLWSGSPDAWAWLRRSWLLRALWLWVGGIALFGVIRSGPTAPVLVWMTAIGLTGTAFLVGLAIWQARATRYLITDRRVALRIGLALPGEANIPLTHLAGASVRRFADGSGDIAIRPSGPLGIGYFILWPHARPWRINHPEPLLRALPDVDAAARALRSVVPEPESARGQEQAA